MLTQKKLFTNTPVRKPAQAADFDRRNLESARLILADPELDGRAEAFAARWAQAVFARLAGNR